MELITGTGGFLLTWTKKSYAYLQSSLTKMALLQARSAVLISQADSNHATAEKTRAEADHVSANAEAIRSETKMRQNAASLENMERLIAIREKMKAAGLDGDCSFDTNGMPQFGFTKSPQHSEKLLGEDDSRN
jgi:hypothetical protein